MSLFSDVSPIREEFAGRQPRSGEMFIALAYPFVLVRKLKSRALLVYKHFAATRLFFRQTPPQAVIGLLFAINL